MPHLLVLGTLLTPRWMAVLLIHDNFDAADADADSDDVADDADGGNVDDSDND